MSKEGKFLIYCLEIYKTERELSGSQVMMLFKKFAVTDYILECYEALHTTGRKYIIDDIDGFIRERQTA